MKGIERALQMPAWDSHEWASVFQAADGNWYGVVEGWKIENHLHDDWKEGITFSLLRTDGGFLCYGQPNPKWRESQVFRPDPRDWQPIETAPRDGTQVDLWMSAAANDFANGPEHNYRETDCWFSESRGGWVKNYGRDGILPVGERVRDVPTHWRAIPEGPQS